MVKQNKKSRGVHIKTSIVEELKQCDEVVRGGPGGTQGQ